MKRLLAALPSHEVPALAEPTGQKPIDKRARSIIMALTGSCALMMTAFGLVTPVFARCLSDLGAGVEVLSWMATASALAQFLLAPFMGALADRFGRRRIVLFALSGLATTYLAFLVARSSEMYIVLRFLQGAFSVGMLPAATGVIADLVPEQQRTRWIGALMSGYALGFTCGPIIGGLLFERWGALVPFGGAFLLDLLALLIAWGRIAETQEDALHHVQQQQKSTGQRERAASLPRSFFAALLLLDVFAAFGMAFLEPQMVFYLYNTFCWTTAQYGLMMGGYGVATFIGQVALSQLGDHLERRLLLALGFLFNSALALGLLFFHQFSLLAPFALFVGLGNAGITTGLGASYLDITVPQHRSVIQGIRESAVSLGAVVGPLLAAFISRWLAPQGIFTVAAGTQLVAGILALVVLQPHSQAKVPAEVVAPVDTDRQASAIVSMTHAVAEVAQAVRISLSRLTPVMGDLVRAARPAFHTFR